MFCGKYVQAHTAHQHAHTTQQQHAHKIKFLNRQINTHITQNVIATFIFMWCMNRHGPHKLLCLNVAHNLLLLPVNHNEEPQLLP